MAPTIVSLAAIVTALTARLTSMTGVAFAIHASQLSTITFPHFRTNAPVLRESTELLVAHASTVHLIVRGARLGQGLVLHACTMVTLCQPVFAPAATVGLSNLTKHAPHRWLAHQASTTMASTIVIRVPPETTAWNALQHRRAYIAGLLTLYRPNEQTFVIADRISMNQAAIAMT